MMNDKASKSAAQTFRALADAGTIAENLVWLQPWHCEFCGKRGQIHFDIDENFARVLQMMDEQHTNLSPTCKKVFMSWKHLGFESGT